MLDAKSLNDTEWHHCVVNELPEPRLLYKTSPVPREILHFGSERAWLEEKAQQEVDLCREL